MKEVIIIRTVDPDGSMFQAIMDALRSRRAEVFELTGTSHDMLTFGDVEIYPSLRTVLKAGEEVHLSHGEFSMLLLLASHPKQVFSKAQLYEAAWGEAYLHGTNSVENIIWRLRRKLEEDPKHPGYIKTVVGAGYKIDIHNRQSGMED